MTTKEAPKRAHRLTLKLDADTLDEMASALVNLADRVVRGELTIGVSGGCGSGYIYELLSDPTKTNADYFAEVHEYLRNVRNA